MSLGLLAMTFNDLLKYESGNIYTFRMTLSLETWKVDPRFRKIWQNHKIDKDLGLILLRVSLPLQITRENLHRAINYKRIQGPNGVKWELGLASFWQGKWDFMH